MKTDHLQKISEEVDIIQLAVELLLLDRRFGPECRPKLKFFLQNRLDKTDFETLNTLTLRGQIGFLAERFHNYLAAS